eukprot:g2432.t1
MGLCATKASAPIYRRETAVCDGIVVHLSELLNIPDMDDSLRSDDVSDIFLTLQIYVSDETAKNNKPRPFGKPQKTMTFNDVTDCYFGNCYHTFCVPPKEEFKNAFLRMEVFDQDTVTANDKICHLDIKLNELVDEKVDMKNFDMKMDTTRRGKDAEQPVKIKLRSLTKKLVEGATVKKRFFLIRHGESLWNEAQHDKNVAGLIGFDHSLNKVGIEQCKRLNEKYTAKDYKNTQPSLEELEQAFRQCPLILCSPLTRCVQTALLTLYNHPTMKKQGLILHRNLREVKRTLGSLDTLGIEVGAENIRRRANECFLEVCGHLTAPINPTPGATSGATSSDTSKDLSEEKKTPLSREEIQSRFSGVAFHTNDAKSKWWTSGNTYDDERRLKERMNALLGSLRYLESDSAILVGHSLFFRALMKFFIPSTGSFQSHDSNLTKEKLKTSKMQNAAVACIDVTFPEFPHEDNFFKIDSVNFLFDTKLKEKKGSQ